LRCTGPERRPCTEEMVREMARRMAERSREHPALAEIHTLTLDSPHGTLSCKQKDGRPCTAEQVRSLNEHVAAPLRCELRFESSRSNAGNGTYTRPNPTSDTAAKVGTQEGTERRMNSTSQGAANGQEWAGALKCTGPERRPCTEEMVRDMARRMREKSTEHLALAAIRTLSLDSPDGTLSCRRNDGRPCAAEQVRSLNEHVAADMRCEIRFENSRSNAGNSTYTQSNTTSDIAAKVEAWEQSLNTTNPTSDSAAKEEAPDGTERRMGSTAEGAARGQGSEGALRCMGPERRACTEEMVRDLGSKLAEKRSEHPALADINTLTLDSRDGTLSCRQNDGKPCTAEQVRALNEHVAAALRWDVRFESSRSNAQSHTSMAQNHTSMPPNTVATNNTSTTPVNSSTTGSSASTQNHTSTAQNHTSTASSRTSLPQNRTSTTQNHASTTGNHNPPSPKPQ
jgi:hypothetical protein